MIKIEYLLAFLLVYSSFEQEMLPKLDLASSKIPVTTPSTTNSTVYEAKLFLLGFGNYTRDDNSTELFFDIYLQKSTNEITTIPKLITILVQIIYSNRRLRFLEEKEAQCSPESENENEKTVLEYNCKVDNIEKGKKVQKVSTSPDKIKADGNSIIIIPTDYANKTCDNINEQTDEKAKQEKIIFRVDKMEQELKTIIITGHTENEEIKDKEIILSFYENEKENNMTCEVENLGYNKYELNCKPKKSIKANLNGAESIQSSGKNIVLDFNKVEDGNIDFSLYGKNSTQKKSSCGLSSGAIVGIILACIAALIATGIAVAFFRRSPKAPMQEMNVDTVNSSNTLKN